MAIARLVRFAVDGTDVEEMLRRRGELVAAVRAAHDGLEEARLARLEDGRWLDIWRWESAELMDAALAGAPFIAETAAAFALTRDLTAEVAEIVDER